MRGAPAITTQISAQETAPGAQITDSVVVSGPRQARRDGQRRAVGPVPDPRGDPLRGHAVLDRHAARRPATARTPTAPVTLAAGRLLHLPRVDRGRPRRYEARRSPPAARCPRRRSRRRRRRSRRSSSDAVVKPGRRDLRPADRHRPRRRRRRRSRSRSTARTRRARTSTARARRTGRARSRSPATATYHSPKATVRRAGFYVFRERIVGTETVAAHQGECAVEAETSLAAPLILGGRGDSVAYVAAAQAARADARPAGAARHRRAGLRRRHRPQVRRARHPDEHPPRRLVARRRRARRRRRAPS